MTAEATTTPATAESLKQKLAQHLDKAQGRLDALKKDLSAMHEEDMDAFRQRREELRKRVDEEKDKAKQRQADIASWNQEKIAHTPEAIGDWRKRRELAKLERRAERAEDYAVDMVTAVALDFEEAEQALLEAMAARFDANTASSEASAAT